MSIGENQGGFREGRGCVDQVFTVRMIAEKFKEKKKNLYLCFMDLEKAYDRVCRKKMWSVLKDYEVKSNLLHAVKAFYENSRACVRVKRNVTDFFGMKGGLRQGCVMSPWLFNVFMDSVVRNVDREGKGLELVPPEGR